MALTLHDKITTEQLTTLYSDPYIMKAFKIDNKTPEPILHPLVTYYTAFKDKEFMGAFIHIQQSQYDAELHIMLLKKAITHSREFGRMMIEESFKDKDVLRITAPAYGDLHTAMNYAIKLGFNLEGIKKDVALRDGKTINEYIYGITRGEK